MFFLRKLFLSAAQAGILSLLAPALAYSQKHGDCRTALEVCEKKTVRATSVRGPGDDPDEARDVPCFDGGHTRGNAEINSFWLRWRVKTGGSLTFAIMPSVADDDIDFVLYRLPGGSCAQKIIVRCMAAGDDEIPFFSPCMGETGLRGGETDNSEDPGCNDEGDNAWLRPVETKAGDEFALLVTNVSTAGTGFSLRFGGSCEFEPCPKSKKEEPKIASKPKPEPKKEPQKTPQKEAKKEPTKPAAPVAKQPEAVAGRAVFSKKTIEVASKKLKISLSDAQVVDGDAVSVWLGDRRVIDRVELGREPKIFEIDLGAGDEFLTVHAEDFGEALINTTTIVIDDGASKQTLTLLAEPHKEESLRVRVRD